jgi:hypothetical protein
MSSINEKGALNLSKSELKVGDTVVATRTVTDESCNCTSSCDCLEILKEYSELSDSEINEHVDYIHAVKGDIGIVEYIDDSTIANVGVALPTVRFEKTGTATMVTYREGPLSVFEGIVDEIEKYDVWNFDAWNLRKPRIGLKVLISAISDNFKFEGSVGYISKVIEVPDDDDNAKLPMFVCEVVDSDGNSMTYKPVGYSGKYMGYDDDGKYIGSVIWGYECYPINKNWRVTLPNWHVLDVPFISNDQKDLLDKVIE